MKTVYTAPKLSSLDDNGIKDLLSVAQYLPQLRLVRLTGVPVRIELNKDKYVEVSSAEEHIDLSAYNETFKKLLDFFYGTAYLYAFVDSNKLVVYDIFTNENFFSTRDMLQIEAEYGLPIAKPIAEGNFTFDYLIEVLNKKINGEKLSWDTFYLLPSVYVDDSRTWPKPAEATIVSKVIIGEKKTYTSYSSYGSYNYGNYNKPTTNTTQSSTTSVTQTKKEEQAKMDQSFLEIFKYSDKKERQNIYDETWKNLSAYAKTLEPTLTEEQKKWFNKYGKFFSYLYSIHSLPGTRQIVYDYCLTYILKWQDYSKPIEMKWSYLFLDMFADCFKSLLDQKKIKITDETYSMFSLFFKEELTEFDKFFIKEEDSRFCDWRYGENNFNSIYEGVY